MTPRLPRWVPIVSMLLCALATRASADRRYFVNCYTPYLAEAGELELEVWNTALNGQGDSVNTAWQNRLEFEYAITDRLTGAAYLNFQQRGAGEAPLHYEGPSLELIYLLAGPGRIPFDPAVYLEVRENGEELEVEPKLLLAHRHGKLVAALNVIGEFEFQHHAPGVDTEKTLALTGGFSHEIGPRLALGVEGRYQRGFTDPGPAPAALFAGPTVNLKAAKVELALGWHPQLWGTPKSSPHLNLSDFSRAEVRFILGVDL